MAHKSNKKIRTLHAEKEAAEKKPEKKESQSQGQLMIAGIAAAVEKSMTTAFSAAQKEQAKVNEKVLSTLESISASQAELVSGLQELALGRLESAAVGDDEDEEADDVQAARKKQPPPEEVAAAKERKGALVQISAAAKMIRSLRAENDNLRQENKRQQNRISAIEASLERYADRVERRSISPEISALLEKSGYDARELMTSKQRLSVADVDQMFAQSGIPLEPQMRAAFKNQLLQLGLMESGEVRRFAN